MKLRNKKRAAAQLKPANSNEACRKRLTISAALKLTTILVPLHFSDSSNQMLYQYVLELAKKFNSEIILLHVLPIHYITSWESDIEERESRIEKDLKKDVQRRLARLVLKFAASKISAESQIRFGSPAMEIITAAKENNADLIIMTAHGHAGRIHTLLGSVSNDVVRTAPCPVLIVRPQEYDCSPIKSVFSKTTKINSASN